MAKINAQRPPFKPRAATALFLQVPYDDWPRIKIGEKTEFRTRAFVMSAAPRFLPTPIVAYVVNGLGEADCRVMVLEDKRYEPLFNIAEDAEAVAREGYESYDHFRRYWRARHGGEYWPSRKVHVWRVRPWCEEDSADLGATVVGWLYGEYFDL